jgi:ribonucleoside-triphosphate reductase
MSGSLGLDKLADTLDSIREECIQVNAEIADAMGINRSAAITTVKPSGTVSQLTGTSSGMHPWHADHYIRTVRQDNKDPLTAFMRDAGIPSEPAFKAEETTTIFSFPTKAPEGAILRKELTALEHLEFWKIYKEHWTEHNPSITVNVRESEWIAVADWVYRNWDIVGGISFLPFDDHVYKQAPYQDCDEATYQAAKEEMPVIDWSILSMYEKEDNTSSSQTLSCVSGSCDLVGSGN